MEKISADLRKTADRMAIFLARLVKDGERVFHGVGVNIILFTVWTTVLEQYFMLNLIL